MNKRPAAVIFDMDGLLFDSEALYRDAIIAAASELGHLFTVEDFLKLVGRPWSVNRVTLQEHIGSANNPDAFRAAWMRHYEGMRAALTLKAGAVELLDRLDQLRVPRAICTSSSHADVEHNLTLHTLVGRFDAVIASGDYARGKPFPDPYLRAAEVLGFAPGDCLALEDSHNGVRAAATAGMQTVMVPDLLPATDEVRTLCKFVARDLREVCAYLDGQYAVRAATKPIIRQATQDDLPSVLALYQHLHPDDPAPEPSAAALSWLKLLSSELTTVIVADLAGLLVSSCMLVIVPNLTRDARPYGVIENVVTHADHRQTGLGRAVLHAALKQAWDANCYRVMLATGSKRETTLRFYEGAGFIRGGKTYFEARPGEGPTP